MTASVTKTPHHKDEIHCGAQQSHTVPISLLGWLNLLTSSAHSPALFGEPSTTQYFSRSQFSYMFISLPVTI